MNGQDNNKCLTGEDLDEVIWISQANVVTQLKIKYIHIVVYLLVGSPLMLCKLSANNKWQFKKHQMVCLFLNFTIANNWDYFCWMYLLFKYINIKAFIHVENWQNCNNALLIISYLKMPTDLILQRFWTFMAIFLGHLK